MDISLPVPYHQQNNGDYCGPACVQMVIDFFGKSLLDTDNYQNPLYNSIIHKVPLIETGLLAGPKGLAKALNCKNPNPTKFSYVCVASESAGALSEHIAQRIEKYETPALVLVYGKFHWIVVTGFKRDGAKLDGFMIHNPWPPIGNLYSDEEGFPTHDLTPHNCGDGRVPVNGVASAPPPYVDRGAAYNHISYDGWVCDYWKDRYPLEGSPWDGLYVAVCPDAPTATVEACYDKLDKTQPIIKLPGAVTVCNPSGTPIMTDLEAKQKALQGMLDHGLQQEGPWVDALAGQNLANPRVGLVQSVNYFHKPGKYYLVWFTAATSGQLSVCARVDGQSGKYIESVAVPAGAGDAITPIDPNGHQYVTYVNKVASWPPNRPAALRADAVAYQQDKLPNRSSRGKEASRQDELPKLLPRDVVWQPCDQSFSPFYAFYHYTYIDEAGNPVMFFIRTHDGRPFSELTTKMLDKDGFPGNPDLRDRNKVPNKPDQDYIPNNPPAE